jgi:flagellar biosynthesis chaperone FliJ
MKKYKYPLEILLKTKDAAKKKIQFQIGKIQSQINKHQEQIDYDQHQVNISLDNQMVSLSKGLIARQVQMVPEFIHAKKVNISLHEKAIIDLELQKKELIYKMGILENEIKVYQDMKKRDYQKYKKKLNKLNERKVEELANIRHILKRNENA